MKFIELKEGCSSVKEFSGCYGPQGKYIAIFGSELRFLIGHFIISFLIGLILLSILFTLNKKQKINIPKYLIYLIPIIAIVLIFFLLAYFFPVRIMY